MFRTPIFTRCFVLAAAILPSAVGAAAAQAPAATAAAPELRRLHATIKRALDPRHILNPGKFV